MIEKPMTKKPNAALDIDALKNAAKNAPPMADNLAARQVVVELKQELLRMNRAKGYTWAQIAEWLRQHGVSITEGTLKNYLYSATPSRRAKAAKIVTTSNPPPLQTSKPATP